MAEASAIGDHPRIKRKGALCMTRGELSSPCTPCRAAATAGFPSVSCHPLPQQPHISYSRCCRTYLNVAQQPGPTPGYLPAPAEVAAVIEPVWGESINKSNLMRGTHMTSFVGPTDEVAYRAPGGLQPSNARTTVWISAGAISPEHLQSSSLKNPTLRF